MTVNIISDLLDLPESERAKVFAADAGIAKTVMQTLSQDVDFQALPESEKMVALRKLSLPFSDISQAQAAPSGVVTPIDFRKKLLETQGMLLRNVNETEDQALINAGTHPLKALAEGIYQFAKPGGPENIGSKLAMGALRGTPLIGSAVADVRGQSPNFFSFENAARLGMDMAVTYPLFASKAVVTGSKWLAGVSAPFAAMAHPLIAGTVAGARLGIGYAKLFTRFPELAKIYAEGIAGGSVITAYEQVNKRIAYLIRDGKLSTDGLAVEYGEEAAKNILAMMGFAGVLHAGKAAVNATLPGKTVSGAATEGIGEATSAMGKQAPPTAPTDVSGLKPNMALAVIPKIPEKQYPTSLNPRAAEAYKPNPALPTRQDVVNARVEEAGKLRTASEVAYRKVFAGDAAGATEIRLRADGGLESTILDDTRSVVKSDGTISVTVPEPVVEATTSPVNKAMTGDLVYVGQRIATVLEKTEKGLRVKPHDGGPFFVPYERVGGLYEGLKPGEQAFKASSGEQVVIDAVLPNGVVRVLDKRGSKYAMKADGLRSEQQLLDNAETLERAAKDITTSAPQGGVLELLKNEGGFWNPFKSNINPPKASTTQMSSDMSWYSHLLTPQTAMTLTGNKKLVAAAALFDRSKAIESQVQHAGEQMIMNLRDMLPGFRVAGRTLAVNEAVSQKLGRYLVGLPKPTDTLNATEKAVLDAINDYAAKEAMPLFNANRVRKGMKPVPPDFNLPIHIMPEVVFFGGSRRFGMAESFGKAVVPTGVSNEATFFWKDNVKFDLKPNGLEIADRLVKFVAQEQAWRDSIEIFRSLSKDASIGPSAQKMLGHYVKHIEGTTGDVGLTIFKALDRWMVSNSHLSRETMKVTLPDGTSVDFRVPYFDIANKTLSGTAMAVKQLNYAAMIGLNARTVMFNLTQPWVDGIAMLPGGYGSRALNILASYPKAIGAVFGGPKAAQYYRDAGVLHDIEELFTPGSVTATVGSRPANALFASEWTYNNMMQASFLGMHGAEVLNRVVIFEARKRATTDLAKEFLTSHKQLSPKAAEQLIASPQWQKDIQELSAYTTNISNFLYGKGYKPAMQFGWGIKGLGTLGEIAFQWNTFALKHLEVMIGLARQARGFQDAAVIMKKQNASQEFAEYLSTMEKGDRFALLKAVTFQAALASFLTSALGISSVYDQLMPHKMAMPRIGSTVGQMTIDAFNKITNFDLGGATRIILRNITPEFNAWQRVERAGGPSAIATDPRGALLSTRSDYLGKDNPYATPSLSEQIFGREGAGRGGVKTR